MPPETIISHGKAISKINVGLKIIRKRPDGYHDLETIFYPLDLHDSLDIIIEPGHLKVNSVHIDSDSKIIPRESTNTCFKAVENFFTEFPQPEFYNIEIFIRKRIPMGGGLAGGSSNAAAVIKFLAGYFGIRIEENRDGLVRAALNTGSDVPFFLLEKPCFASGRGENMLPLVDFTLPYDILVVNPNIHVSTKEAFGKLNFKPGEERISELSKVKIFDPSELEIYGNDFEPVVFEMYPRIGEIKKYLMDSGAVFASLTGSGASVYGLLPPLMGDKKNAILKNFSAKGYFTYLSSLKK